MEKPSDGGDGIVHSNVDSEFEKSVPDVARSRVYGGRVLKCLIHGGDTVDVKSEVAKYSKESISEYTKVRFGDNLRFLESEHTPDFLVHAYSQLIQEYPILRFVGLKKMDDARVNSFFSPDQESPDGKKIAPFVNYHFDNPDRYLGHEHDLTKEMHGLDTAYTQIALRIGASPNEVLSNRRLAETFIMLHEFGHAFDFLENYLRPSYAEAKKTSAPGDVQIDAMRDALTRSSFNRAEDMTECLGGGLGGGSFEDLKPVLHSRLESLGVNPDNRLEVMHVNGRTYRQTRSERFADDFAIKYIMRHKDEFFYDPRSGEAANGRIQRRLDYVEMPGELMACLDLDPGTFVEGSYYSASGQKTHLEGYLGKRLRIGGALEISVSGDSKSGNVGRSRGAISRFETCHDVGRQRYSAEFDNGSSFRFFVADNHEKAPRIELSGDQVMKELGIKVGDEIAALKMKLEKSSDVDPGHLMMGRLDNELTAGHQIILAQDDQHFSAISNAKRFYREWNRYFVQTQTSIYEILPVKR